MCERVGLRDPVAFRRAFAKATKRNWRHDAALIKNVTRWFAGPTPVRIERANAMVICRILKVDVAADIFKVRAKPQLHRPPCYALAESLSHEFTALSERMPRTPLPMLDLAKFDALLNYANWKAALVRSSDVVLVGKGSDDDVVQANSIGARITARADAFAESLYGVLFTLLEDAKTNPPRKEKWVKLVKILDALCGVLQAAPPTARMQRKGTEAVRKLTREIQENNGSLIGGNERARNR
jgi:hypothetical protein